MYEIERCIIVTGAHVLALSLLGGCNGYIDIYIEILEQTISRVMMDWRSTSRAGT